MKKIILVIFLLSLITIGCTKTSKEIIKQDSFDYKKYSLDYAYMPTDVTAFCIDQRGYLYTIGNNSNLQCYNLDGELYKEYKIHEGIYTGLCTDGENLYYIKENQYAIVSVNIKTGQIKTVYQEKEEPYNLSSVDKMLAMESGLYLIARSNYDEGQAMVKYEEDDGYIFLQEQLLYYDFKSKTVEQINIKNVKLIDQKDKTTLLLYAYDEEGGYYFTTYDVKNKIFGEKNYTMNFKWIVSCAYNQENNKLYYYTMGGSKLSVTNINNYSDKSALCEVSSLQKGNDLAAIGDFIFYLDTKCESDGSISESSVRRLQGNSAVASYVPIRILTRGDYYDVLGIYTDGFTFRTEAIQSDDELANRILSADSEYDLLIVDSTAAVTKSIRDKGAFYALEESENVQDYLSSCFDYVKDTATTEDGHIWMIPLDSECLYYVYNEVNCKDNKIAFESSMSEMYHKTEELLKNHNLDGLYNISFYMEASERFWRYADAYGIAADNSIHFHTPLFEELSTDMKIVWDEDSPAFITEANAGDYSYAVTGDYHSIEGIEAYYNNFLFEFHRYPKDIQTIPDLEHIRAINISPALDKYKNPIYTKFLIVNPKSDNLNATMQYVSALCDKMKTIPYHFLLKDIAVHNENTTQLIKDLYQIYSNGHISINWSFETIKDVYISYLHGEISLEEYMNELERRFNAYMKE